MKKIMSAVVLTLTAGIFIASSPVTAKQTPAPKAAPAVVRQASAAQEEAPVKPKAKLISFGAEWCGACRELEPELARFKSENKDVEVLKIELEELDTDKYRKYIPLLTSPSIPYTVILDSEGNRQSAFLGALTAEEIAEKVNSAQSSALSNKDLSSGGG